MEKVIEQNTIDEQPLPEGVSYDTLTGKPTSLADISIADAAILASVSSGSPAGGLDLSIQGWQFDGTFSASSATAIAWTAGTLRFKDGTTFSIASGSVSGLSTTVPRYIYFSKTASLTILQTSVTASDAVGQNKVLMGVVQGNAAAGKNAIFQVFGGAGGMSPFVSGVNIAASSITSAMIVAGTIVASNIAAGTITANEIAANTITANKLSVSTLSAISADLGTITAGTISAVNISGSTITGSTLTTASSGQRVVLTSTLAQYYNSNGTLSVETYASTSPSSSFIIKGQQSASSIYLDTGSAGTIAFLSNGTLKIIIDGPNNRIYPQTNGGIDLGVAGANWNDIYNVGEHSYQGISQPIVYWGYVSGTTMNPDNTPGWSVSNGSTGIYVVTHNLGHTNYAVNVTPFASTVKNITVSGLTTTTFTIRIANLADTLENNDWMFMLAESPL